MTRILESGRIFDGPATTRQGMVLDDSIGEPSGQIIEVDFDGGFLGKILAGDPAEDDGGGGGGGVVGVKGESGVELGGIINGVKEGVEESVHDQDKEKSG